MKNQKLGFTLMELLVVIVIIGILAAMLFPVFSRIQERGREVKCANNLRQLHTAAISYINSNGGYLPYASSSEYWRIDDNGTYGHSWRTGWVASYPEGTNTMKSYWWDGTNDTYGTYCITNGTLFQYLGDKGDESVYVCPTMLMKARDVLSDEYQDVKRSYGMNRDVGGVLYSDIDGLSRKILFADQGFDQMAGALQYLRNTGDNTNDDPPTDQNEYEQRFYRGIDGCIDYVRQAAPHANTVERIGELHGRKPGANTGMANVVFADGHVEKVAYPNTEDVCEGNWEFGQPVP